MAVRYTILRICVGNFWDSSNLFHLISDLIRRYDETVSAFEQMSEEIKGKKDAPISYVMELDKRIGEQVDYLFNAPVAKSFFLDYLPVHDAGTAGSSLLKMC